MTSLSPPNRPAHRFEFTPVDLESRYVPPDVGAGAKDTSYTYDADRAPDEERRPGGVVVDRLRDSAGRLSAIVHPNDRIDLVYETGTGRLASLAASQGGGMLAFEYDGPLLTRETQSGAAVSGSVSRAYDNNFRFASETVRARSAWSVGTE